MSVQALQRRQTALGRALSTRDLPASCVIQSTVGGARTPVATVACRVVYPRANQGQVYPDDQRAVSVLVPADIAEPPTSGFVVVDGTATYRITHVPPIRADDLLRVLVCVEART